MKLPMRHQLRYVTLCEWVPPSRMQYICLIHDQHMKLYLQLIDIMGQKARCESESVYLFTITFLNPFSWSLQHWTLQRSLEILFIQMVNFSNCANNSLNRFYSLATAWALWTHAKKPAETQKSPWLEGVSPWLSPGDTAAVTQWRISFALRWHTWIFLVPPLHNFIS